MNFHLMPLGIPSIRPSEQNQKAGKKAQEKEKSVSSQVVKHRGRRSVRRKTPAIDVQATGQIEGHGRKEDHEKRVYHENRAGKPDIEDQEKANEQFEPWKNDGGGMDHFVREDPIVVNDFHKGPGVEDLLDARIKKQEAEKNPRHQDGRAF